MVLGRRDWGRGRPLKEAHQLVGVGGALHGETSSWHSEPLTQVPGCIFPAEGAGGTAGAGLLGQKPFA